MKKINLKNLPMDEVLDKSELKKIVGGNGSGCQNWYCYCPGQGSWTTYTCSFAEADYLHATMQENCPWGGGCGLI
ncbi:TIGR04149 family rSAM-modified RiPP [Pedobacter sp. Hv1]|uniref:TIGR04149 family rSAM-modified RiPP n=1 Tax=Pedobacter sp. Hv1 TaxID=1740090 RepID=UPI0006D8D586|nr:TIGR04149 family rSAM-modified RiPP [Pedobacter sp. Hv1]KQB98625.1 hypothetical protein AQF98_21535 [Pedobacter sp. Hv1]